MSCSKHLCFDAQQATEKALKALFVLKGTQVPRTHSIGDLLTELGTLGFDIPPGVKEAASLTDDAVATRYPGPSDPVVREDLDDAVRMAGAVFSWASEIVTTSE